MHMIHTKLEAIDLVYSSYNFAKKRANGHITKVQSLARELLDAIGSPDKEKRIVLVTGSKGKGSTASFISSLLHFLGFKTGLFTSPHYFEFNERIQVNGKPIPDKDLIRLANNVSPYVKSIMNRTPPHEYLGPIAINLAIGLLYFAEKDVDYIVLEAGKGGFYDDTNVVSNQWAVITPIMNEHVEELGPSISDIIAHKLGIVKPDTIAFISKQQKGIEVEIQERLIHHKHLIMYGDEFSISVKKSTKNGMTVDFHTKRAVYQNTRVPLLGLYQCENIALAVQVCEEMIEAKIDKSLIGLWLKALKSPGKCEVLSYEPIVIADATINEHSAAYLQEVLKHFSPKFTIAIIGLSSDKDYRGVIDALRPFTTKLIITKPENGYKLFNEQKIYEYASQFLPTKVVASTKAALKLTNTIPEADLFLLVGNHSFIAEAKQWFKDNPIIPTS